MLLSLRKENHPESISWFIHYRPSSRTSLKVESKNIIGVQKSNYHPFSITKKLSIINSLSHI